MKTKKPPMRMCVITKEKLEKKDLIRVVNLDNVVSIDLTNKANGRGAYLKKDKEVVEKAKKTKALNRHLNTDVDDKIYDEILSML